MRPVGLERMLGDPRENPWEPMPPPGESKGPWEPMVTPWGGQRGSMQTPGGFPLGSWIGRPIFLPCTQAIIALTPHTAAPNEVYAHASRLRCRHLRFCLFRAAAYEFPQKRYQHSGGFHVIPIVGIHQPIAKAQRVMRTQLKSNSFLAS